MVSFCFGPAPRPLRCFLQKFDCVKACMRATQYWRQLTLQQTINLFTVASLVAVVDDRWGFAGNAACLQKVTTFLMCRYLHSALRMGRDVLIHTKPRQIGTVRQLEVMGASDASTIRQQVSRSSGRVTCDVKC